MNNSNRWLAVFLVPLIPVVILYVFFAGQNFFALEGFVKGVVATGPIAAYFALVYVALRVWEKTGGSSGIPKELTSQYIGQWRFESESSHQTQLRGTCIISESNGRVAMNGRIEKDGHVMGTWNSAAVVLDDTGMYIVYNFNETTPEVKYTRGVVEAVYNPATKQLDGSWVTMGENSKSGIVNYTRL
ncbi:MAG: hypothetical protein WCG75_05890 [Armatimonadota bacterium]